MPINRVQFIRLRFRILMHTPFPQKKHAIRSPWCGWHNPHTSLLEHGVPTPRDVKYSRAWSIDIFRRQDVRRHPHLINISRINSLWPRRTTMRYYYFMLRWRVLLKSVDRSLGIS